MDNEKQKNQKPSVSFVIPHLGRDELLIETISSIEQQDISSDQYEILIISEADEHTCNLQKALDALNIQCKCKLLFISSSETISYARNFGASIAAGEYLAFIDADIRLASNWIRAMIDNLSSPDHILVSAVQVPDNNRTHNDIIRSSMSEANLGDANESLPGHNLFLSAADFNLSKKFPEHMQTCEDSAFTNSLIDDGKLLLTAQSTYVHLGEDLTLKTLFKKEIWRGKTNLVSVRGRSIKLRELPSLTVPFAVLAGVVLLILSILFGSYALLLSGIFFAVIPPLLFSLRLRKRSSIDLSLIHLFQFYFVYFVARGLGMTKMLFVR